MSESETGDMIYSLMIKFGQKEYLEKLQAGILYCKTVRDFAKMEETDIRHHSNEGISNIIEMKDGTIEMRPVYPPNLPWGKLNFKTGQITTYRRGNIFCMSRFIIPNNRTSHIDIYPGFDKFGDHYLVVLNQPIFLERIQAALKKGNLKATGNMVEYANLANHAGKRSVFLKDECHSWQVEYRIFFDTEMEQPLFFEIGDISDISIITPLPKNRKFEYRLRTISN